MVAGQLVFLDVLDDELYVLCWHLRSTWYTQNTVLRQFLENDLTLNFTTEHEISLFFQTFFAIIPVTIITFTLIILEKVIPLMNRIQ